MNISVRNFPVFMKIGHNLDERIHGQEVLVSLSIDFPINEPPGSLENTIDYGEVLDSLEGFKGIEVKLLESVVFMIGRYFMLKFKDISKLSVDIEKPVLPNGLSKGATVRVSNDFRRT